MVGKNTRPCSFLDYFPRKVHANAKEEYQIGRQCIERYMGVEFSTMLK